ncbi:hypothetical protein [Elstera cyanobacteriorum]|uniref:hypothetical protein n=1 Tax=Elstera cyanobacteriorum TaxID=2022747 RepID=UPI002355ABF1|nr:hypothetical protein [Elstera cyanobacteriorum]MCK6442460.1 hypothetical protein [Elstera cyanobacteriorum]
MDGPLTFSPEIVAETEAGLLEKVYIGHRTPELLGVVISLKTTGAKPAYMDVLRRLYPQVKPTPIKAFWVAASDAFIERWRTENKILVDQIFRQELSVDDLRLFADPAYKGVARSALDDVYNKRGGEGQVHEAARRYISAFNRAVDELYESNFQYVRKKIIDDPSFLERAGQRAE